MGEEEISDETVQELKEIGASAGLSSRADEEAARYAARSAAAGGDGSGDHGTVTVATDDETGRCRLTLWDGTETDGPSNDFARELEAFCGDFEFLLNSDVFFEMRYDPQSFSPDLVAWLQSEFEPVLNQCLKKRAVTIEEDDEGHLSLHIAK